MQVYPYFADVRPPLAGVFISMEVAALAPASAEIAGWREAETMLNPACCANRLKDTRS